MLYSSLSARDAARREKVVFIGCGASASGSVAWAQLRRAEKKAVGLLREGAGSHRREDSGCSTRSLGALPFDFDACRLLLVADALGESLTPGKSPTSSTFFVW